MSVKQYQTQKAIKAFLDYVISQAKSNLIRGKKNSSKALYNSLKADPKVNPNSIEASILAEEYGEYQDKGVSGKKRKFNTPFSYKDKRPPAKAFDGWIVKKGIAPRNEKGQFQNRKGIAFAIANSVFMYGIKPSRFLSDPFEKGFKNLPNEIVEAYGLDVETFLKQVINNGKKN